MIRVQCLSCEKQLRVPEKYAGRRVKCPGCGKGVRVEEPEAEDDSGYSDKDYYDDEPEPSPRKAAPHRKAEPQAAPPITNSDGKWWQRTATVPVITGVGVAMLLVGYFSGRWHLQYQISSAFEQVGKAFAEGAKQGATSSPSGGQGSGEPDAPPEPEPLSLGEEFETDLFTVNLKSIEIGKATIKSFRGEEPTPDDVMLCTFSVTNTSDRKVLNFFGRLLIGTPACAISDDVGNSIDELNLRASQSLIGAIRSDDNVNPGESRDHLIAFKVPLPKTEHLTLTVNLPTLIKEATGTFTYQVNASQIVGL